MQIAKVIILHKRDDINGFANYRPISLAVSFSEGFKNFSLTSHTLFREV